MNAAQYIIIAILIAAVVLVAYNLGRYHGARASVKIIVDTLKEACDEPHIREEDAKDEKI